MEIKEEIASLVNGRTHGLLHLIMCNANKAPLCLLKLSVEESPPVPFSPVSKIIFKNKENCCSSFLLALKKAFSVLFLIQ